MLWEKTFGGSSSIAYSMEKTADGGFVLAGKIWSPGSSIFGVYLVRTDAQGNLIWEKTFGDAFTASSVKQTADGGYVLAGETSAIGTGYLNAYLARTDASGNMLWQTAFGGGGLSGYNAARDVQTTMDGGFVIAGVTAAYGAGGFDAYLVRTDAQGNRLWHKTYGGTGTDSAYSIQKTADGGFVLGGDTAPFGGGTSNTFLIRMDAQGNPSD